MRVAVFTGNQPRHLALVERLAAAADEVCAVLECGGAFPTTPETPAPLRAYFEQVVASEAAVFGAKRFLPANVRTLALRGGDLNGTPLEVLAPALAADAIVVFGASYIKGALCDALVARGAVNIHAGVSPQYRGAACNFWALHDGHPELVGCTIHRLSKGLDSGAMLFHALPAAAPTDPFVLGMRAVDAAQRGLAAALADGTLARLAPVPQDRARELRYTRGADFTEAVAAAYLAAQPTAQDIGSVLARRDLADFVRPFVA